MESTLITMEDLEKLGTAIAESAGWMTPEEFFEFESEYNEWLDAQYSIANYEWETI